MHPHLQLQDVLFTRKRVREGVHVAVGKREILGRHVGSTELDERHDVLLFCGGKELVGLAETQQQ